jgi:hypothetical protein
MIARRHSSALVAGLVLGLALASASLAQSTRTETVSAEVAAEGKVFEGSLKGDESTDYVIAGQAGQTLSVDLLASNASLYFNILPEGSQEALFVGSSSGNVADIPLPAAGTYVVQVYLMRNAARRDEGATYSLGIGLAGADFADGLAGGPDWWQVSGMSEGALNIRSGPDTRYDVVGKAQNGEAAQNRGCRMTGQTRWCRIRVDGSGVQGWVAGRYLVEGAAPAMAEVPPAGRRATACPSTPRARSVVRRLRVRQWAAALSAWCAMAQAMPGSGSHWATEQNARSCSKAACRSRRIRLPP